MTRFDAILLDLSLPDSHGLDTLTRTLRRRTGHAENSLMTGSTDENIAMEAVCYGAEDYLVKGQTDARSLLRAIRYAIDRKRAQEALAAEARPAKERSLTLAHELRNPPAPIRNSLSILVPDRRRHAGFSGQSRHQERQVQILSRLVDDLLYVPRISRGKIELRKERLDVAAVVHRAVETSHHLSSRQGGTSWP